MASQATAYVRHAPSMATGGPHLEYVNVQCLAVAESR